MAYTVTSWDCGTFPGMSMAVTDRIIGHGHIATVSSWDCGTFPGMSMVVTDRSIGHGHNILLLLGIAVHSQECPWL